MLPPTPVSSAMRTILIADDDEQLRNLLCLTLRLDGYTLLEAGDGDTAWQILREQRPDVAVLDIAMPGLSGLDIIRAARRDASLVGTRLILLTARARAEDVMAGLAAGADLYLTKPFSPLELLAALEPDAAAGAA